MAVDHTRAPRGRRPRGRPYRPPVDSSSYADPTGGAEARIAWLLGTWRLTAKDGTYASRRTFVPTLAETGGLTCDETRVSRWESGGAPAPAEVLTGYERVLDLPRHSLRAIAVLLRSDLPTAASRRRTPDEEFDRLMEVVLDGAPTGADWFTFADELGHRPPFYLRQDQWASLSRQLVNEMSRSLHVGYLTRRAALRRLLASPVAGPQVVAALEEYVAEPGAVRVADAASLGQYVPGADATSLAIRLLHSGPRGVQRGALRATSRLLAHARFDERALSTLEHLVISGLRASDTAHHLADVVRRLPPDAAHRVRGIVRRHPALEIVDQNSEIVPPDVAEAVALELCELGRTAIPTLRGPDPMLVRLVREALFHSHDERRSQAAYLLMLSPYQGAVAAGCARMAGTAEPPVQAALARLMRYCASSAQLPTLVGMASADDPEPRLAALVALGNNPHRLTERQAQVLLAGNGPWLTGRDVDAASYAFGMHGLASLVVPEEQHLPLGDAADRTGSDPTDCDLTDSDLTDSDANDPDRTEAPARAAVNAAWWQAFGPRLVA